MHFQLKNNNQTNVFMPYESEIGILSLQNHKENIPIQQIYYVRKIYEDNKANKMRVEYVKGH